MQIVGKITKVELQKLMWNGLTPEQAVITVQLEAEKRFPLAETVLIQRATTHDGFDIITM